MKARKALEVKVSRMEAIMERWKKYDPSLCIRDGSSTEDPLVVSDEEVEALPSSDGSY